MRPRRRFPHGRSRAGWPPRPLERTVDQFGLQIQLPAPAGRLAARAGACSYHTAYGAVTVVGFRDCKRAQRPCTGSGTRGCLPRVRRACGPRGRSRGPLLPTASRSCRPRAGRERVEARPAGGVVLAGVGVVPAPALQALGLPRAPTRHSPRQVVARRDQCQVAHRITIREDAFQCSRAHNSRAICECDVTRPAQTKHSARPGVTSVRWRAGVTTDHRARG